VKWSYGITTVPQRLDTTLPATLDSLRRAGFPSPRLFVDGDADVTALRDKFELEDVTLRSPCGVRAFGNWALALWELHLRVPHAERIAVFQDDILCSANLREYLERVGYPNPGYLNLCTYPVNAELCPRDEKGGYKTGWYKSNQLGQGAQGLVFNQGSMVALLSASRFVAKPLFSKRPTRNVDGAIVDAMTDQGYAEFVHCPSLICHMDGPSAILEVEGKHQVQPPTALWMGEDFDLLSLLK
jgi:hypothetical protein